MREPYYENQGANTYLIYGIGAEDELDTMSLGMLTNNKIPGFAVASFAQMDAEKFIKYNVSAKVSAAQLFAGPVNKRRLIGFLSGIIDAMISAEEYMIDPATILLDMEHIYSDVSTCETILICLPIMSTDSKPVDLGMFFKNIIFQTQFDQTENCDHVAQIINYLNTTPVLSLPDFKELLERLSGKAQPAPQPVPQPVAPVQPARPVAPVQPVVPAQPVTPAQPARPVQPAQPAQPARPVPPVPPQRPVPPAPPVPNKAPGGFAVPGKAPTAAAATPATPAAPEKEISFMYLMQHYNKENAAAYKAQQEAKKAQKNAGKAAPAAPAAPVAPVAPAPGKAPVQNPGFAVPGQAPVQRPVPPVQPARPVPQPSVPRRNGPLEMDGPVGGYPGTPVPPQRPVQPVAQPAPQPVPQPAPQSVNMNFGETTVLGGGSMGETTVLGAGAAVEAQAKPHLIRTKNNERITLDKPVFRIGKEKSYVDYFIGDNTAISRSHANIISRDGAYYVVDTNSTNHTYVNGGMIQSNVETKISHDTKIRLANEEFTFKMY